MADEKKDIAVDEVNLNRNFIYNFIEEDIAPGGQFEGMTVHTRFPPEPNGLQGPVHRFRHGRKVQRSLQPAHG